MSTAATIPVLITKPASARMVLRAVQLVAALGLIGYALQGTFPSICSDPVQAFFEGAVYPSFMVLAGALCLSRVIAQSAESLPWVVLSFGFFAWAGGDIYGTVVNDRLAIEPIWSAADPLWLAFYPACYVAVILLVRSRTRDFRKSLWLDGAVGVFALGAVGAALVLGPIANNPNPAVVTGDLVYLLGDFILLAVVVGAFALCAWRPGQDLGMIGAGLAVMALVDGFMLYEGAAGLGLTTTLPASAWPASALIIAFAAWRRAPQHVRVRLEGLRVVAMPTVFALISLGLLTAQAFINVHPIALGLAIAALVAAIGRMSMTFRENVTLLHRTRYQAYTDALTGLENRRKLMLDMEEALPKATEDEPVAVALFDLDGFKQYNDTFGHPAGDALLARLGKNLSTAVEGLGSAYRLGGDEFCVLTKGDEPMMRALIEEARQSLSEQGEAFAVASSCGLVILPREARNVSGALNVADERLYEHKGERKRASVSRQTSDALVQVVREREPALGDHQSKVAELSRDVGRQLAMPDLEVEQLGRAGELHDIGKIAIPDAILSKPGPLDEIEWGLVRQHTLVGERIVAAAPTLAPIAQLVRGSHERFDGSGYPDGLMGDEIPLGARIVAACDAYHVMICERPYRKAISSEDALIELRHCAGEQFDPVVVDALCELLVASDDRELSYAAI